MRNEHVRNIQYCSYAPEEQSVKKIACLYFFNKQITLLFLIVFWIVYGKGSELYNKKDTHGIHFLILLWNTWAVPYSYVGASFF